MNTCHAISMLQKYENPQVRARDTRRDTQRQSSHAVFLQQSTKKGSVMQGTGPVCPVASILEYVLFGYLNIGRARALNAEMRRTRCKERDAKNKRPKVDTRANSLRSFNTKGQSARASDLGHLHLSCLPLYQALALALALSESRTKPRKEQ